MTQRLGLYAVPAQDVLALGFHFFHLAFVGSLVAGRDGAVLQHDNVLAGNHVAVGGNFGLAGAHHGGGVGRHRIRANRP